MNTELFNDVHVGEVVVVSGVRPAGRVFEQKEAGRPRNGLLYVRSGGALFSENGKRTASLGDGGCVFIPKGHVYKMQYTKDNTAFVLVNFELFDRDGNDVKLFDHITPLGESQTLRIASVMAKMEACGAAHSPVVELRKKELMYRLLCIVCEERAELFEQQVCYPQILAGVLLLKETYLQNIPITEFARACNVSISSFRDLFRKQYGVSPLQYRNMLRINRARELLEEGTCTVSEAAYASGFDNIGYFCNCYKKITGNTPSKSKNGT